MLPLLLLLLLLRAPAGDGVQSDPAAADSCVGGVWDGQPQLPALLRKHHFWVHWCAVRGAVHVSAALCGGGAAVLVGAREFRAPVCVGARGANRHSCDDVLRPARVCVCHAELPRHRTSRAADVSGAEGFHALLWTRPGAAAVQLVLVGDTSVVATSCHPLAAHPIAPRQPMLGGQMERAEVV